MFIHYLEGLVTEQGGLSIRHSRVPLSGSPVSYESVTDDCNVSVHRHPAGTLFYPQVPHDEEEQESAQPPPERAVFDIIFSAFFLPHSGHSIDFSLLLEKTIISNS